METRLNPELSSAGAALPTALPLPLLGLGILVVLLALWRAPWKPLAGRSERQHAFYACLLILPVLWLGSLQVAQGVSVHLLGMTPLVLIFGWELAVVLGTLAVLALGLFGHWQPATLPMHHFLAVIVPVLVTQGLLAAADRLPRTNLFVYLLGVGFLGGTLSMVAALLVDAWLQGWEADHALVLLLAFPEGFVAGTIVTALTIFYPSLMRTYDDERYLGKDPQDR